MLKPVCILPFNDYFFNSINKQEPLVLIEEVSPEKAIDIPHVAEKAKLNVEELLPQTQVDRFNQILASKISLKKTSQDSFDLTLHLVEFWQKLASIFNNEPTLIGSFVGHLYDPEQGYHDIDYVNPVNVVIIDSGYGKEELQRKIHSAVKHRADEVRNSIEDLLIEEFVQAFPAERRPTRLDIWKMFFGNSVLINDLIDLDKDCYGNRFSLLRLGILEIKTVFEVIIIPLGSDPVTIGGIEKPCAFSKDGLKITLKGIIQEGLATSTNTKIISVAGPIREAIKCLKLRELTTTDADGSKFVKWLDYVTLRKYFCAPELAVSIFANCLTRFSAEQLLSRFERHFRPKQEKYPIGVLSCLLNIATLCDSLIKKPISHEHQAKAILLKDALNEFAPLYLSRKSQGYLKQHPEFKTSYLDFCKILLLVVPTMSFSKRELDLTFRELISYEEQTYSLIFLDSTVQFFTQFIHHWKTSPLSLFDLYKGILLQVRLKGDLPAVDHASSLMAFVYGMQQFLLQRKDYKNLTLLNHFIALFAPEFKKIQVKGSINWTHEDLASLLNTLLLPSLKELSIEMKEDLLKRASGCADTIMDYFVLVLSEYTNCDKYEFEILKSLPRALSISQNLKIQKMQFDPSLSRGGVCAAILKQCPQEIKFDLWAHYLDNNLFDTPQQAILAGYEISQMSDNIIQVWNKIISKSEFNRCPSERALIFVEYVKVSHKTDAKSLMQQILAEPHYLQDVLDARLNFRTFYLLVNTLLEESQTPEDFQATVSLIKLFPKDGADELLLIFSTYLNRLIALIEHNSKNFELSEPIFREAITHLSFVKNSQKIIINYLTSLENNIDLLQKAFALILQSGISSDHYTEIFGELYKVIEILFDAHKNKVALKNNVLFFESCVKWLPYNEHTITLVQNLSRKLLSTNDEILISLAHRLLDRFSEEHISIELNLDLVQRLLLKFDSFRSTKSQDPIAKAYEFYLKAIYKLYNMCEKCGSSRLLEDPKLILNLREIISGWTHFPPKALTVENAKVVSKLVENIESSCRFELIKGALYSPFENMFPFILELLEKYSEAESLPIYLKVLSFSGLSANQSLNLIEHFIRRRLCIPSCNLAEILFTLRKKISKGDVVLLRKWDSIVFKYWDQEKIIARIIELDPEDVLSIAKSVSGDKELSDALPLLVELFTEALIKDIFNVKRRKLYLNLFKLFLESLDFQRKEISGEATLHLLNTLVMIEKHNMYEFLGSNANRFRDYACKMLTICFLDPEKKLVMLGVLEAVIDLFHLNDDLPRNNEFVTSFCILAGFYSCINPNSFPLLLEGVEYAMNRRGQFEVFINKEFYVFVHSIEKALRKNEYDLPSDHINELIRKVSSSATIISERAIPLLVATIEVFLKLAVKHQDCVEEFLMLLKKSCFLSDLKKRILTYYSEIGNQLTLNKQNIRVILILSKHLLEIAPEETELNSRIKNQIDMYFLSCQTKQ